MIRTALPAIVLAFIGLLPVAAMADDELTDLDVTMEVLDDESELAEFVAEMRGPDQDGIDRDLAADDALDENEDLAATDPGKKNPFDDDGAASDGFERDIRLPEDELGHEDDFATDQGESLDLDRLPDDDYLPADDRDGSR